MKYANLIILLMIFCVCSFVEKQKYNLLNQKNWFVQSFGGCISIWIAFSSNYIKANESTNKMVSLYHLFKNGTIFGTVPKSF